MPIVQFFGGERKEFIGFDGGKERPGVWELPRDCARCGEQGSCSKHMSYKRKACEGQIQLMMCKRCGKCFAVLPHFLAPYARTFTDVREDVVWEWSQGRACGTWSMRPGCGSSRPGSSQAANTRSGAGSSARATGPRRLRRH